MSNPNYTPNRRATVDRADRAIGDKTSNCIIFVIEVYIVVRDDYS
ncbi:hypothetical protein [Chamaesiphon sp. OTE_20_metabat_361]|nr:hypothetical protein [Chamaesiphon sp. OTE_20_metabat_361]